MGWSKMSVPAKIVVIGAGSASFGENTLSALMRSPRLRGCQLALVDRSPAALGIVSRLAERLNREWDCQMHLSAHPHHAEALEGAHFVVSAIEVGPREALWRQDYEIPLRHGVRQPYAENGGPGGFAHAARDLLKSLVDPLPDSHLESTDCPGQLCRGRDHVEGGSTSVERRPAGAVFADILDVPATLQTKRTAACC